MNNSYFILSKQNLTIERFHICTWDIENTPSFLEIGIEFTISDIAQSIIDFKFVAPFIKKDDEVLCLASSLLSDQDNCKFIFNDTIKSLSEISGDKRNGAILDFTTRNKLIILPLDKNLSIDDNDQIISFKVHIPQAVKPKDSIYIRFLIKTAIKTLSRERRSISHKTYTYDVKLNEKRNLPDNVLQLVNDKYSLQNIKRCFCFHVVPHSFDISFINEHRLKNIRELEVVAFRNYLSSKIPKLKKMKEGKYLIIFNKDESSSDSYSFFTTFSEEIIGINLIMFTIFANIFCGLLFAISSLRMSLSGKICSWKQIPLEYWVVAIILSFLIIFLFKPYRFFQHKRKNH
jgi:hypothetical protein